MLSQKQLDALAYFDEKQGQKYFTLLHKGVRFRQYVGVLQVGQLTIEILPKTDQYSNNFQQWQNVLLELLHACNFLKIDSLSQAPLELKSSPLLWLYLELFAQQIEELLKKGLHKNYRNQNQNSTTWKGQINFAKQLQINHNANHKIFTRQQSYDYQHPAHQILYKALKTIEQTWISPKLRQKIQYLCKVFPPQVDIHITEKIFDQLYTNSKFKSYHKALDLAKMISLEYSPNIKKGSCPVLAILFDMNKLFEQFIYQQLQQTIHSQWTIRAQVAKSFWAHKKLRPDIYIQTSMNNIIIDTKWKILQNPSPSNEDLRQMYAYNHNFDATQSILVYPNVLGLNQRNEAFNKPISIKGKEKAHFCKVVFVDILNKKGTLNKDIAKDIIQQLD